MKQLHRFFLVAVVIILQSAFGIAIAQTSITPAEVRQKQEAKMPFILVDVRTSQLFNVKHIEGAINIPAFVIHKRKLPKGESIILYDGGIGSHEARDSAGRLISAGYKSIFILEGGIAKWEALGLPLAVPTGVLDTMLVESITVSELIQAMKDGLPMTLVDLRRPEHFRIETITGSQNIDSGTLLDVSNAWRKDSLIILFDSSDDEAMKQAEKLRRAGFKMVRFLFGGYPEWKRQSTKR